MLDTNVCVAAMRKNPPVIQRLSTLVPGDCVISTITAYELFTGVEKCADPERERSKVARLLNTVPQLPFDSVAATEAARIRAELETVGQPIGPYDVLLAGHALVMGLVFVTNNTSEFARVAGLSLENWHVAPP